MSAKECGWMMEVIMQAGEISGSKHVQGVISIVDSNAASFTLEAE